MKNEQFLETMRKRFRSAADAEKEIREAAREDLRFVAGEQWNEKQKKDREASGRPALVHNRLQAFVNQITNEARQQKPQIRFSPVEDADDDTAEVYEGLARHIQYSSKASIAYETAVDYQASCSFGYFRLLSDYCDSESFDQELKVESVPDPFSVYGILMPAIYGRKPRFAFVVQKMPREEYKAAYGETDKFAQFAVDGDSEGWISDDDVRIAEYWYVETKKDKIALVNGQTVPFDQVPEGVTPERTREVETDVVKWVKTNGCEVLEQTEWVGSTIPVFPVLGKSLIVDGKPQLFSLVRFMRDPQQLINYTKSRIAEALATSPISPWIVAEGQLEGRENEWATANTVLRAYLQYQPVAIGGTVAPAPHRQVYEPPIQALSEFLAQEIDELKAISGIYDSSLGNESNETSGIAIARRQQQTNTANMHFLDNLSRAHEECGRAIAEAIPKTYDTARDIRILGGNEEPKIAKVNQLYRDTDGSVKQHNLSAGKYDITVTTGRSFSTKKLETFDTLSQLVQAKPELMQLIGDIIFKNSDMAGADEIAERLKKMLPPQLADQEDGQAQIPPQFQAAFQQSQQVIEQLTQALQQLQQEQQAKMVEVQSRERIAQMQEETKRTIAVATLSQNEGLELLRQELAATKHRVDLMHQAGMKAADQQHQVGMQDMSQQHQASLQDMSQQHQATMAQQAAEQEPAETEE